jgi:hypothetical protein
VKRSSEPNRQTKSASPEALSRLLAIGDNAARAWQPEELAAVFRHQMAAPVSVNLGRLDPSLVGKLRTLADASGLLLKSLRDLLQHPAPPLELLALVKEYAKLNQNQPDSLLPAEIADILYYMSIAAAQIRWGKRITTLNDDELRRGFAWALSQRWIDAPTREMLAAANATLTAPKTNSSPPI